MLDAVSDPLKGTVHHDVEVKQEVEDLLGCELLCAGEPISLNESLKHDPAGYEGRENKDQQHKAGVIIVEEIPPED